MSPYTLASRGGILCRGDMSRHLETRLYPHDGRWYFWLTGFFCLTAAFGRAMMAFAFIPLLVIAGLFAAHLLHPTQYPVISALTLSISLLRARPTSWRRL